jgi:hypothetical protein
LKRKDEDITISRVAARIGHLRVICQFLLATEGVNLPKIKLFNVVACLKFGLAQFNDTLDQSS